MSKEMRRVRRLKNYKTLNPSVTIRVPYTLYRTIWRIAKKKGVNLVEAGRILNNELKEEKKILERILEKKERSK